MTDTNNVRLPETYTMEGFLTAGETNAQGEMPIWLLVQNLINLATLHANALGVGYADLKPLGIGWVLTHVSIEMLHYPGINENYRLTTWIEGYNRLYSDRCFALTDANGNVIGNIRTNWVAMDMVKRTAADLSVLPTERFVVHDRKCPVQRTRKQQPLGDDANECEYTFKYSDTDFNRHVNTVMYIRQILNQWSMDRYDSYSIERFDISFHAECHYADTVAIRHADMPDSQSACEIINPAGHRAVLSYIRWKARS